VEGQGLLTQNEILQMMNQIYSQQDNKTKISPEMIKSALMAYINQFDPYRIYLLESEVAPYRDLPDAKIADVVKDMRANNFHIFEELNQVIQKSIQRARTLRSELEKTANLLGFKTANDEKFSDPDLQTPFAKDIEDLKKRNLDDLRNYVARAQLRFGDALIKKNLGQTLSIYEKSAREKENLYLYLDNEGKPLQPSEKENLFVIYVLKALAKSLDAHTTFYTQSEAEDLKMRLEKGFQGIGINLEQSANGKFYISEILAGSPAMRSGKVKVGDEVLAIDQESTVGASLNDLMQKLKNGQKKEVTLNLLRKGGPIDRSIVEVTLKKEEIMLKGDRVTTSFQRYDDGIIGIIQLHSFYQGDNVTSENDVKAAIANLRKKGDLRGLILDLRDNSGGFLNQAVKVAGLFITNGVVVISKYFNGEEHFYRDLDSTVAYDGPLIVLTSRATASAAEIVAQALQDYGVALVVGDASTYGKGTIQNQTVTSDNSESFFKVTVGKYYTVSGKTPQIEGVQADVVVPGPNSNAHIGEKYLGTTILSDAIPNDYDDTLADVQPDMKTWYLRYYLPTLQHKKDLWRGMLFALKSKSASRINPTSQKDLTPLTEEAQLTEAVNVLKDMIQLESLTHGN